MQSDCLRTTLIKFKNMSLFNWFSGKSELTKAAAESESSGAHRHSRPPAVRGKPAAQSAHKPTQDPASRAEERKVKRQARREQLYVAIRESMTRAGVLSASFKFKVLSLDQAGDKFMVMMDISADLAQQAEKLPEIEALMVQSARVLFGIVVTSVYWRLDVEASMGEFKSAGLGPREPKKAPRPEYALADGMPAASRKSAAAHRYEPIHDEEVSAFKQALVAASAQAPATLDATGKSRSGLRSHTLFTGFEDTEMPESAAAPALSATQYGELR